MASNELPDTEHARPPDAAEFAPFRPYVPPQAEMREFTVLPLVVGTLLGVVFGASSLYLVLKVGMTVSFVAGVLGDVDRAIKKWSTAVNPLFAGPWPDLLSLIPFAVLVAMLYAVGRRDDRETAP
jgi:hypothetical protein